MLESLEFSDQFEWPYARPGDDQPRCDQRLGYLNNKGGFYDGTNKVDPQNGTIPCNNGWEAWVDPVYSPLIYICNPFVTAAPQPGMQGVYTIHEMLHTLGLPEGAPPMMSSSQITNMVIQACGQ